MALCFCFGSLSSYQPLSSSGRHSSVLKSYSWNTRYSCKYIPRQAAVFQMKTFENETTPVNNTSKEQQQQDLASSNGNSPPSTAASSEEEQTRLVTPSPKRYGATIDMDGKSNVWAVEPRVTVQSEDETKKANWIPLILGLIVALIAAGLPLLPLTNPDQFR
ncbi:hypothetical protein GAYE_SCF23G4242 [Galdieria yellowstonensis]|uniref:Uncharacterized protein n=1 Tax=Galdieria yellowstonensis TaxID=3028027 RepID=A0AAV9IG50_9RHOD|nr:hypothetical protein GAYE_SCF23G4242 [Galdieria yellowstonensis]